ncbi:MAG: UDP-N-acetylmuramate--L-alanine ligase [Bacteroidia bacterium]|nr:UDP-N-acetylmuramate--L-alanine ligase [Bacteroidia bacterium]MCZ2141675.1 UDP-N-acetylmuramate--L-alanine ligase [Bacteroidia bacterium]
MNFNDIKQVYFLGIGGIGMSAIARYFHTKGKTVMGYDKTETELTKKLIEEGIAVHYTDNGNELANIGLNPKTTLVVLTPAIPQSHEEWNWFKQNEFIILKRSQVLGLITDNHKTIGVAGTHGKTTTSTLLAHILKQSNIDCSAFLGGVSTNYNNNLLLQKNQNTTTPMVVEADEFDRSFLTLHPHIGIITSTDADHLDIYGKHSELLASFADYAAQIKNTLYVKQELEFYNTIKNQSINANVKSYSITNKADVYADDIRIIGNRYYFNLHLNNIHVEDLYLGIPGLHNVENAVAASAAAIECGVTIEELKIALASFKGVKRRFEYIIDSPETIYIDDYAHHPTELTAIISSVKKMYPSKFLTVIFQPHLYSRTRDFVDGFAESLSLADEIILLPIYPARELPIEGVTSEIVFDKITQSNKLICNKADVIELLSTKKIELLLTVGAGDIDTLVQPIKLLLQKNTSN